MNKIGLIIKREYLRRVSKKSFLLLTFLTPFLFAALVFVPLWLSTIKGDDVKQVAISDTTGKYAPLFKDTEEYTFITEKGSSLEEYRKNPDKEIFAFLNITDDLLQNPTAATLYSQKQIPMGLKNTIDKTLSEYLKDEKLASYNIDNLKQIIEDSKAAHTAGEWIIDTPATATTSGSKHKECTVCGYMMATETIPATGGGEHTHSYGSDWKYDADNHWHECSCGDKADKAAHDFKWVVDKEATATQKGSKHEECKVCGYKKAAVEILATGSTTKPTDPTQTNSNTGAEGPKTGDNSNMILWIALLFISSGAVIGITVYSKKKKENAE